MDNRRRVVLPASIVRGITWLSGGGDALGILDAPGQIRLVEWAKEASAVVERRRDVLSTGSMSDPRVSAAIRALDDRYRRLWVDADGRLQLPHPAVIHLELTARELFAYAFPEHIELWSPSYRLAELERVQDVFAGLP